MRDIAAIRKDFPILNTEVNKKPLVYFDNAATMQVPRRVTAAVCEQYERFHSNIHRGIYHLSEQSSCRVDSVRQKIADFIGAKDSGEIIFTSGTTAGINMVAQALTGLTNLSEGDFIVTTQMEHHSNYLPWLEAAKRCGAKFSAVKINENADLDADDLRKALERRPKILALTCVSNVTGTVNPVKEITRMAHDAGAFVLLDAAQAIRHERINVADLDADFLCFSGHKIMAPGGTGVLYGKKDLLEKMPPVCFGGGMVSDLQPDGAVYEDAPYKFEAGTLNIAGIIGLGAAVDYLTDEGTESVATYEARLLEYTRQKLSEIHGVNILGAPEKRAGAVSFNLKGCHPYDVAALLDKLGIAVRSGHMCAIPLLRALGTERAVRVSPAFYNTFEEADILAEGLARVYDMLKKR